MRGKLTFECSEGHRWEATADNVLRRGSWCASCSASERGRMKRMGLEDMQSLARSHGGRCLRCGGLGPVVVGGGRKGGQQTCSCWGCGPGVLTVKWDTFLLVRCGEDDLLVCHPLTCAPVGSLCPVLFMMHSTVYRGAGTVLEWECAEGHVFWKVRLPSVCCRAAMPTLPAFCAVRWSTSDAHRHESHPHSSMS
jgi:hypothetical protein